MKIVLGVLDLVCSGLLIFSGILGSSILLIAAFYLITKGLIFLLSKDVASIIDVCVGVYFVFLFFDVSSLVVTLLFAAYLLQKGILSLF